MLIKSNPAAQPSLTTKNSILNALPTEDLERLLPEPESFEMPDGKILYYPDEAINYVYFPDTAMISVVTITEQGQSVEAGVVGWEGIAGFNVLMGVDSMPNENIVQLPGSGWRLPAAAVKREFKRCGALHDLCLRFMHAMMIQLAQIAVCNRLHSNEERLSRWLLMSRDRSETNELKLTQEFLAIMLGANRSSVTMSAIALQSAGYIKYTRGLITVLDREGLEDFSCDCYKAIRREYAELPE